MSVVLPNSINYDEPLASLPPDTVNIEVVANPVNGATFGANSQIIVDLGNRGFLDPASLFIRYKFTAASAGNVEMVGTPVYTPFLRLDTLVNSATVETINNYNVISNMLTNLKLSVSDKMGQQFSLGYVDSGGTSPVNNEQIDGRTVSTGETGSLSGPLYNCLSFSEKMIPLFLMNNVRLVFTLDSLTNMCNTQATKNPFTAFTISNFEVVYNIVDFGSEIQNNIMAMDKIRLKSQSFASSISPLASATSGNVNLVFNHRYSSVKAAYLNCGGGDATKSANKNQDAYDITSGNGDYQIQVNGVNYPSRSLSTINNKAGMLQELRKTMNTIFDKNVAMSINSAEYSAYSSTSTTSFIIPSKFYVGFALQKLTIPQKAFFTGVNTNGSPITVSINIGTATSQIHNVMLILNYDMILEIEPASKQVVVIQ
jgi:hypothetical protein